MQKTSALDSFKKSKKFFFKTALIQFTFQDIIFIKIFFLFKNISKKNEKQGKIKKVFL
jgi:hypothetical protein